MKAGVSCKVAPIATQTRTKKITRAANGFKAYTKTVPMDTQRDPTAFLFKRESTGVKRQVKQVLSREGLKSFIASKRALLVSSKCQLRSSLVMRMVKDLAQTLSETPATQQSSSEGPSSQATPLPLDLELFERVSREDF